MSYTLTYTPIYSLNVTTIQNILLNANLFHRFLQKARGLGKIISRKNYNIQREAALKDCIPWI